MQDNVDVGAAPAAEGVAGGAAAVLPGDVAIASRTRTQPSAVELLAHQLPGRNTHTDRIRWGVDTKLRNQVQLSTYPDCIGGDLTNLTKFADQCAAPVDSLQGSPDIPCRPRARRPVTLLHTPEPCFAFACILSVASRHVVRAMAT